MDFGFGSWDADPNAWGGNTLPGVGDTWGGDQPASAWNTMSAPSWWERNKPSDADIRTMQGLTSGLSALKPMADPNAANARPAAPPAQISRGQGGGDLLAQYLQTLQQRQQQMRNMFIAKPTGLLGG